MGLSIKQRSYLLAFSGVVMWSFSEISQKLLQDTIMPISKSALRFIIGMIPLIIILIAKRDFKLSEIKTVFKRNRINYLIAAVFGYGISNLIYFVGITNTQANIGSVIYGTYPLFISIYSIFLIKERGNLKLKFVGYLIGFIAIFVLTTGGDFSSFLDKENLSGNFLVLIGAMIFSLFSTLAKKIQSDEKEYNTTLMPLKNNVICMFFAGLTNLVLLLFDEEERTTFLKYDGRSWALMIFLGVIVTGIGTWLFFEGVHNIEVSKGISLAMFKPIIVTFLAYFILHEHVSNLIYICLPIIFFAVYLINIPKKTKDTEESVQNVKNRFSTKE